MEEARILKNTVENISPNNTDILGIQDSLGSSWLKITWLTIKTKVATYIMGLDNVFNGINSFTKPITVPPATDPDHAVNKNQLDAKQDKITSTNTQVLFNDLGTIKGSTIFGINQTDKLINFKSGNIPTTTTDTLGDVGDITIDDKYMYFKTSGGWVRTPNQMINF